MHRKVAGEILHDVNIINVIKIVGSSSRGKVSYRECVNVYCILLCEQIFTFLFQCPNHSILLLKGSRYEEIQCKLLRGQGRERGCGQGDGG